jgi:hypothetical protein
MNQIKKPITVAPGRLVAFANARRDDPQREGWYNDPHYVGVVSLPDGRRLQVSLWVDTSRAGKPYISGSVRPEPVRTAHHLDSAELAKSEDIPQHPGAKVDPNFDLF